MATHSSILAWKIPWTEEPGGLQSMGLQELDSTERLNRHAYRCLICRELRLGLAGQLELGVYPMSTCGNSWVLGFQALNLGVTSPSSPPSLSQ